jgi:hypothetical protein
MLAQNALHNFTFKNLKSVADMPELTKQKISKELAMGRIAGPFSVLPFPTLRATTLYGQFSSDFSTSLTQMGE